MMKEFMYPKPVLNHIINLQVHLGVPITIDQHNNISSLHQKKVNRYQVTLSINGCHLARLSINGCTITAQLSIDGQHLQIQPYTTGARAEEHNGAGGGRIES